MEIITDVILAFAIVIAFGYIAGKVFKRK